MLQESRVRQWQRFPRIQRFWRGMRRSPLRWILLAILTTSLGLGMPHLGYGNPVPPIAVPFPIAQQEDWLQQGRSLYRSGRYAEAAQAWQRAASQFAAAGNRLSQAMALSNLALAYQQLGQWNEATTAIAASLDLVSQPQSPAEQGIRAQALNTQGSLFQGRGQPEQALHSWEQATQLYQAVGDSEGSLRSQLNQVQALRSLGLLRRALSRLTEVNQTLQSQPDSAIKAAGLRSLGDTLRLVGDLHQSTHVLQQSLAIARQLNPPGDISATLLSLGNTALADQNPAAALTFYQQAATAAPDQFARLQAEINQFRVQVDQGNSVAAKSLLPEMQASLAALPVSHGTVYARIHLAQAWIRLTKMVPGDSVPDSGAIAPWLETTVTQTRSLGDRRAESYALGTLGAWYEQRQQWQPAQTNTQQALLIAQAIAAPDIAYQWQWQLGRVLRAQRQTPGAIAAYTQAVSSLQAIRNDLVAINTDVQFSFRETVEPVYRQLVELLVAPPTGEPSQANLETARSVLESLQLAELDNFFQEACLQARPVQVDRVDPTAALFYPIMLENRLEVILSIPGRPLRHYGVAIPRAQLTEIIQQTRQLLSPAASSRDRRRLSQQLYEWLIRPAEADLQRQGIKTLVFVPDEALRDFPIAALSDGSQFLIEKYSIALTPGLQLLDPQPLPRGNLRVFTGGLTEARQGFAPLPGVATELAQIGNQVNATQLLNAELTRSRLEIQLQSVPFNVVHLATHGQFSSNADDTFILTWDDRLKVRQLGTLLETRDRQETTPLELLVLSACQTAAGDDRAALGLAGVAVRSGARSTLASLWSVNDEAAAELMIRFYQELLVPQTTKSEALRRAQVSLIQDVRFNNPYYWSAFVLVGNWL